VYEMIAHYKYAMLLVLSHGVNCGVWN